MNTLPVYNNLYHNGRQWVLQIIIGDSNVEVPVTDAKKEELERAGIELYDGGD